MRIVHKFAVSDKHTSPRAKEGPDDIDIEMPSGAVPIHFGVQHSLLGSLYLWALVDDEAPMVKRRFRLTRTDQTLPELWPYVKHVGTVMVESSRMVEFHLFDLGEVSDGEG